MKAEIYQLTTSPETTTVRFVSRGPRGEIPKIIQFELLSADEQAPVYNLPFGDGIETIDDLAVSANGDTDKILATVAAAAEQFLTDHPKALLYATGSTPARTRLYRIGLVRSLPFVRTKFLLFGLINGGPEPFEPGRPYQAFIAQMISA